MTSPFFAISKHLSASPSWAIPISAPAFFTSLIKLSRWVEPQFSFMFQPVGLAEIAVTVAPALS
jgi:hypothetical protein